MTPPPPDHLLTLTSDQLTVGLTPGKGADIVSLIDRGTDVDVLWKTPWGRRDPARVPWTGDSQVDFLARYPGGWQQLIPHAGPRRIQDGVELGFHGEASVVPWRVLDAADDRVTVEVELFTAPLRLTRELFVDGRVLRVQDTVANLSPDPVRVHWVQHPGFGAPFIDESSRITSGATTFVTDAENPGAGLPADAVLPWPIVTDAGGAALDLRVVPGPGESRAIFGALTRFETGWCTITSPSTGLQVRMDWDPAVFPHAWFWQECHGTPAFPWFRRAYVVAVEPANVLPGEGTVGALVRGSGPMLAGGARITSRMTVAVTPL